MRLSRLLLLCVGALSPYVVLHAEELCQYVDATGAVRTVSPREAVPLQFRTTALCQSVTAPGTELAKPGDVNLKGNSRREEFRTSLGVVELRWQRSAELLFGTTPNRAVVDSMSAVSKALRQGGVIPYDVLPVATTRWQIVLMDEKLPESQIPQYLISNCHPGWMTPPSNIYLVADRIAQGCSERRVSNQEADTSLARVLIHEMGHVVEYHLLRGELGSDRRRAEGFASWFEQFATDYSQLVPQGSARKEYLTAAADAIRKGYTGVPFKGSFHDYALASTLFHAIVKKGGPRKLIEVYEQLANKKEPFESTVERLLYWSPEEFNREAAKAASSY